MGRVAHHVFDGHEAELKARLIRFDELRRRRTSGQES
jgi:hypothetical protein